MEKQTVQNEQICLREEIGLYLDGELSSIEEINLEKHLAVCATCLDELNSQKEMLLALDFAFEQKNEIELPKDFTRVVVANAESRVRGLSSKKECSSALFLSLGLFLLIVIGLGAETEKLLVVINDFGRHFLAIGSFIFHLVLDIITAVVVILRCLSQQVIYSPMFMLLLLASGFVIFAITISHLRGRFNRT